MTGVVALLSLHRQLERAALTPVTCKDLV